MVVVVVVVVVVVIRMIMETERGIETVITV